MESQPHTPGPWGLDCGHAVIGGQIVPLVGPDTAQPAELWANSALIAAAPDLLAALKGLYETGAPDGLALTADEIQARFDAARSAINKAEGR